MAAPTKDWVSIADGQVDADSPLDTTLLTAIRDDLVHLREWLADPASYSAAISHDHDGANSKEVTSVADGSITPPKLAGYSAGDDLISTAPAVKCISGNISAWTKLKEIKIDRGGVLRVKFDLKDTAGGNPSEGQVYRNGSPAGTLRSTTSTFYVTFSEDISGWVGGDLVQLYCRSDGLTEGLCVQNFSISVAWDYNCKVLMDT
jgi:hypothetical protein